MTKNNFVDPRQYKMIAGIWISDYFGQSCGITAMRGDPKLLKNRFCLKCLKSIFLKQAIKLILKRKYLMASFIKNMFVKRQLTVNLRRRSIRNLRVCRILTRKFQMNPASANVIKIKVNNYLENSKAAWVFLNKHFY